MTVYLLIVAKNEWNELLYSGETGIWNMKQNLTLLEKLTYKILNETNYNISVFEECDTKQYKSNIN